MSELVPIGKDKEAATFARLIFFRKALILLPELYNVINSVSDATTLVLTMAMVGLGLNVNLRDLRHKALRPLIAMSITSILLSALTFILAT